LKIPIERTIFFFNGHHAWGGGEKWHFDTACLLNKEGFSVTIIAAPQSELSLRASRVGIPMLTVRIGNLSFLNPFKLFKLYRILRSASAQSIVLNLSSDVKAAGLAARLAGVSRIIYRRGSAIPIRDTWFNRFLFRYIITDIIANSEETKRTILANNADLFPKEKIQVIYNGIDLQQFDQRLSVGEGGPSGMVILGHVGRLSPEKNQKFLIDVTCTLRNAGIDCCLKIAGAGPLMEELKVYAAQRGVQDQVVFMGFLEDVSSFLASVDIFLLSSHWEGFGYVLIEAMAAKKPVVAFESSSTPEIVCDGVTGYLVPHNNHDVFVQRIIDLTTDTRKRISFGRAGRERVERMFSVHHSYERLKKILELNNVAI